MKVQISFVNRQTVDGQEEWVRLNTAGEWTLLQDGWRLVYEELSPGMDRVDNILEARGDQVTITRKGAFLSTLVLQQGRRFLSDYGTPYGRIRLGIYTQELTASFSSAGGTLRTRYALDINGSTFSEHDITLTITNGASNGFPAEDV